MSRFAVKHYFKVVWVGRGAGVVVKVLDHTLLAIFWQVVKLNLGALDGRLSRSLRVVQFPAGEMVGRSY